MQYVTAFKSDGERFKLQSLEKEEVFGREIFQLFLLFLIREEFVENCLNFCFLFFFSFSTHSVVEINLKVGGDESGKQQKCSLRIFVDLLVMEHIW